MKSLYNIIILLFGLIASVFSREITAYNYEATFYGCPDECSAQENPSCGISVRTYFCALSSHFKGYSSHCGQYAVVMLTDGSKRMVKAKIVDSCTNCDKYHVDLSKEAFKAISSPGAGVVNIIYGIYSKDGKKLAGPYENKASHAASKLGISTSSFISAFDANAQKLAASHSYSRDFDVHAGKTTTTTTTTITTKTITGTVNPSASTTPVVNNVNAAKLPNATKQPAQETKTVSQAVKENKDDNGSSVGGIITAVGGTMLGAAGVGLVFMKKKNPNQYEDLKQKFPEAFTQVKRGLSRSATHIKRRMTRKVKKPTPVSTSSSSEDVTDDIPENVTDDIPNLTIETN